GGTTVHSGGGGCAFVCSADESILGLRSRVVRSGRLSAAAGGSEVDEREGRRVSMQMRWSILLGLLVALLMAGCADSGNSSDNDRRGGLYGGIFGGGARP